MATGTGGLIGLEVISPEQAVPSRFSDGYVIVAYLQNRLPIRPAVLSHRARGISTTGEHHGMVGPMPNRHKPMIRPRLSIA